jgi:hypothetical protein
MKYTIEELENLIDDKFYENEEQDITGSDANEICIAFLDSLAKKIIPLQYHELNIMMQDLDINNQVEIEHELGTTDLKIILYNPEGKRVYNTHFDFNPIDNNTIRLIFYSGIPYKRSYKGVVYKVS